MRQGSWSLFPWSIRTCSGEPFWRRHMLSGVNIRIKIAAAPPDLWHILTRATYGRSLMGCQTHLGATKVLKNGFVAGHAYTVTGIRKVDLQVSLLSPLVAVCWGTWAGAAVMTTPKYQKSNRKLPPAFFAQHQPVNKNQVFLDEREVTHDFHLEPGVYVIVPSTLEPHQESEFILQVFSREHVLQ
ncbi:calpain-14-like [Phalacrocorax aristotelis]|uniref:calpain-14-like n=1 Tax=Phalacrocorax aristotelis TaxID=126867 RepID=UPI003F4B5D52